MTESRHNTPIINPHVWVVIMAGGTGNRFWPLSQTECPKQFIDVMGVGRSMLQVTFERYRNICRQDHIIIVTGRHHEERVHAQLPDIDAKQILGEPLRRNTAPCIAYAAAVIRANDPEAIIVVSPSDHAVFRPQKFEADINQAVATVSEHDWIITLGAQPVNPNTTYGYIQMDEGTSLPGIKNLHPALTFTEKPPVEIARQFIASGEFFWNTGVLVWSLSTLVSAYRKHLPAIADAFFGDADKQSEITDSQLDDIYSHCETISVDFGIMEKADNVQVLTASFGWSDVETWDSLYDVSGRDANNNAVLGDNVFLYNTRNCMVDVPSDKTVVVEGLDGYIVASSGDTFMVCRRQNEELVFKFASDIEFKKVMKK